MTPTTAGIAAGSAPDRPLRVLVSASGTVTAQSVAKGLRNQDELHVEIVGIDSAPLNAGRYLFDEWQLVPPVSASDYIDVLLGIVRSREIGLLIPIFDGEFEDLARARSRFEDVGCVVAISSPDTIACCNDKVLTARFFVENGFSAPALVAESDAMSGRCRFPLVLKPRRGRASIGVERIERPDEVAAFVRRAREEIVLQEMVSGSEFTVDVTCDLDGRVLAAVPRKRIETKSGVSTKGCTFRHDEILEGSVRMAALLGIRGHANIQGFLGDDGLVSWIEINPRFSGTLPLTLAAGVNSPLLLARAALHLPVEPRIGDFGEVVMMRYWEEVFVTPEGRLLNPLPQRLDDRRRL